MLSMYIVGESQRHEFQAETTQLLNIVAKTLYSEKEVSIKIIKTFSILD